MTCLVRLEAGLQGAQQCSSHRAYGYWLFRNTERRDCPSLFIVSWISRPSQTAATTVLSSPRMERLPAFCVQLPRTVSWNVDA
ncbi:MAG: hypothetical protein ACK559_07395, partial [bacterium]